MSGGRLLQDRLQAQAGGFDGLLSLIPAKMYYGEDNKDQWQRKKQTKAEAKAARRAKLDPDSELNRNAKEVMDERAKSKRKLQDMEEEEQDDDDDNGSEEGGDFDESFEALEGVEAEKPLEGLKKKKNNQPEGNKKRRRDDDDDDANDEGDGVEERLPEDDGVAGESQKPEGKLSRKEEKRAAKKEKRKEKRAEKKAKQPENPEADKKGEPAQPSESSAPPSTQNKTPKKKSTKEPAPKPPKVAEKAPVGEDETRRANGPVSSDMQIDEADRQKGGQEHNDGSSGDSEPHSPTFDTTPTDGAAADAASASTSISSAAPPSEKAKHIKIPNDTSALRARLAAKIEALRAARKADGPDGKPIRTRQELIESRRAKEAQRKAHKKELRKQAKLEEQMKREEALASNSPTVMSPAVDLGEDDGMSSGNFAFGRVAFADGTQMSHDLSYVMRNGKKKGPSDPKTALLKAQAQKKRLQELDEEKSKDIAEKEAWLTARRRAEGEKVHDNEAMLKKTVKRKEAAKRKSEKAWKERQKGVSEAQREKQKKREENIRKRREEKLMGKAGKKKKGGAGGAKKKGRPGFEGSLGVGGRRK